MLTKEQEHEKAVKSLMHHTKMEIINMLYREVNRAKEGMARFYEKAEEYKKQYHQELAENRRINDEAVRLYLENKRLKEQMAALQKKIKKFNATEHD